MRELIPTIEQGLGDRRLSSLRRDPDAYQQFWLGVLEALARVDWSRETVGFLISSGYGAVDNMRRAERSKSRVKVCPECGRTYGYRTLTCRCGAELESRGRVAAYEDVHPSARAEDLDLHIDIKTYVELLSGREAYVARRWLLDRADLLYANHLKQIAWELGVSVARVAQIKGAVRLGLVRWLNGAPPSGHQERDGVPRRST